ncbi:unnamed protein product, partial [Meganyctiphanes norvegica]
MGFNKYGFKRDGCSSLGSPFCYPTINNTTPPPPIFDMFGYTKVGYNILGLDRDGRDVFGFNISGFDKNGCNYFNNGPYYILIKERIGDQLKDTVDDSVFINTERICPQVSEIPEWWYSMNFFDQSATSKMRKLMELQRTVRPTLQGYDPWIQDLRTSVFIASTNNILKKPYLPVFPEERLCLQLRPYSGCPLGSPVVDCEEEEVCTPYYVTHNKTDEFDAGNEFGVMSSFKEVDCPGHMHVVCRVQSCYGVCAPAFYDASTGEEVTCQDCVDEKGILRADGASWEEVDSCRMCSCENKQVICEALLCPEVSCSHPVIPHGNCCPTCHNGCQVEGRIVADGDPAPSPLVCEECWCQVGSLECATKPCPTLNCTMTVMNAGDCCPVCERCDTPEAQVWQPDSCTYCRCVQGYPTCMQLECPILECEHPAIPPDNCCPLCYHCDYGPHHIMHGSQKQLDSCTTCTCSYGNVECIEETCPLLPCDDPIPIPGECCLACPGQCRYDSRIFQSGDFFTPSFSPCLNCTCKDARVQCFAKKCPEPPCSGATVAPGKCCPLVCPDPSPCYDQKGRKLPHSSTWPHPHLPC